MYWVIGILIIFPIPMALFMLYKSLNDFNNWIFILAGPLIAICWFGALCLWIGAKIFG